MATDCLLALLLGSLEAMPLRIGQHPCCQASNDPAWPPQPSCPKLPLAVRLLLLHAAATFCILSRSRGENQKAAHQRSRLDSAEAQHSPPPQCPGQSFALPHQLVDALENMYNPVAGPPTAHSLRHQQCCLQALAEREELVQTVEEARLAAAASEQVWGVPAPMLAVVFVKSFCASHGTHATHTAWSCQVSYQSSSQPSKNTMWGCSFAREVAWPALQQQVA